MQSHWVASTPTGNAAIIANEGVYTMASKAKRTVAKGSVATSVKRSAKAAPKAKVATKATKGKGKAGKVVAREYQPKPGTGLEFTDATKLRVLVTENPKRGASAVRFAKAYLGKRKPTTVAAAIDNGATRADIRWDAGQEFIKLG